MTCEEFTVLTDSPVGTKLTRAVRAAYIRHSKDCPACHVLMSRKAQELAEQLGEEWFLRAIAYNARLVKADMEDPEFKEIVE